MNEPGFRKAIRDYVRLQAKPPDKFSHQARVYSLARRLAGNSQFDDDVLFAAAWLHDLGVFIGHRPRDPVKLAGWDHVAYVLKRAPALLNHSGFPPVKVQAVQEAIRTHLPHAVPTTFEGTLLRDADMLEQLGAVGILRTASKVGRDTRFPLFSNALKALRHNLRRLPPKLRLASAKRLAKSRTAVLRRFLDAAESEAAGLEW